MKVVLAAMAATLVLAGCQTGAQFQESLATARPAPPAIKAALVSDARDFLADPYSVRDAEISYMPGDPMTGGSFVCVKANARNAMGGYTGRQTLQVPVRNGRLIGNIPNGPACAAPGLRWEPFPELEALRDI